MIVLIVQSLRTRTYSFTTLVFVALLYYSFVSLLLILILFVFNMSNHVSNPPSLNPVFGSEPLASSLGDVPDSFRPYPVERGSVPFDVSAPHSHSLLLAASGHGMEHTHISAHSTLHTAHSLSHTTGERSRGQAALRSPIPARASVPPVMTLSPSHRTPARFMVTEVGAMPTAQRNQPPKRTPGRRGCAVRVVACIVQACYCQLT